MARNTYDWNDGKLTFVNTAGKVELDRTEVPVQYHTWLIEYGLKQWVGSGLAKAANGTPAEYLAVARELFDRARNGEFLKRAGGGNLAVMTRAYEIIAGMMGKTADVAAGWMQEYLDSDEERREQIRAKPHMKSAIAQARAERNLKEVPEDGEDFDPNA